MATNVTAAAAHIAYDMQPPESLHRTKYQIKAKKNQDLEHTELEMLITLNVHIPLPNPTPTYFFDMHIWRMFTYAGVSISHLLVLAIFLLMLHENTDLCCHQCTTVYVGVKCMLVSERALYVGVWDISFDLPSFLEKA